MNKEHVFTPGSIACPSPDEFKLGAPLEKEMENDVKFFWDAFIKAHEAWVRGIQEAMTPILEEFLKPTIEKAGLDPKDFKIVWKRPELEYYHG